MKNIKISEEIELIKYYPYYKRTLLWYQDAGLCKQVDNRDSVYDLPLLKAMYNYLNQHGYLYYIKYKGRLCGDVCLQPDGEVNIVVAKPYQNKHIGRTVVLHLAKMAKERHMSALYATIYAFNTQSRRMFECVGFQNVEGDLYRLDL